MKYRSFYQDSLLESRFVDSYKSLPNRPPYGFVVYSDGQFGVVDDWGGHEEVAGERVEKLIGSGGIRIAIEPTSYEKEYVAEYLPTKATDKAKRTAKDLVTYYNRPVRFERARWYSGEIKETSYKSFYKELLQKEDKAYSFDNLPDKHPYGFVV